MGKVLEMSTRGQRAAESERANKKRLRRELGPVRHYEKKWVAHGHIRVYKWITTEERTEGVFIKPKCDPPYRTAALVHGRITRGLINSLTDVEANDMEAALAASLEDQTGAAGDPPSPAVHEAPAAAVNNTDAIAPVVAAENMVIQNINPPVAEPPEEPAPVASEPTPVAPVVAAENMVIQNINPPVDEAPQESAVAQPEVAAEPTSDAVEPNSTVSEMEI